MHNREVKPQLQNFFRKLFVQPLSSCPGESAVASGHAMHCLDKSWFDLKMKWTSFSPLSFSPTIIKEKLLCLIFLFNFSVGESAIQRQSRYAGTWRRPRFERRSGRVSVGGHSGCAPSFERRGGALSVRLLGTVPSQRAALQLVPAAKLEPEGWLKCAWSFEFTRSQLHLVLLVDAHFSQTFSLPTSSSPQQKILPFQQFIFVLRKKGGETKKRIRMKEKVIEKGDCGPPTRKVSFVWDFVGLEPSGT